MPRSPFPSLIPLALLALGCGSSKPAEAPRSEAKTEETSPSSDAPGKSTSAPVAPRPACGDSTCFPCGDGYCPTGFYCDESAPGGAACAWTPACAKTSCQCLTKTLAGCTCEDRGGPIVQCKL